MAVGRKTGGRQKGTPNKVTGDLRGMILGALAKAGGEKYLVKQAAANPTAFLTLVGKVLPMQVTGKDGGPVAVEDVSPLDAARRVAFLLTAGVRAADREAA